jgi:hypothetical protein
MNELHFVKEEDAMSARYPSPWFGGLALLGLLGTALPAHAQLPPNLLYDGRPVLARVRFPVVIDPASCSSPDGLGDGAWSHDYPMSVQGMMKAATEVTSLEAPVDSFVTIMSVTDPEFMKYPIAMVTEPGCWNPTDTEAKALRAYVQKGGFLLIDDLTFGDGTPMHLEMAIARVEAWMRRVLPEGRLVPVPASDPIFNGFFQIGPQDVPSFEFGSAANGTLYGVYRDNDPTKALMAVVTYRGILGHHWRWVGGTGSGLGDDESPSGKAYRLGLNILVYGLSH